MSGPGGAGGAGAAGGRSMRCPTCRAPVTKDAPGARKVFPFCSQRCYMADLGRWLGEEYRIPGEPAPEAAAPPRSTDDES